MNDLSIMDEVGGSSTNNDKNGSSNADDWNPQFDHIAEEKDVQQTSGNEMSPKTKKRKKSKKKKKKKKAKSPKSEWEVFEYEIEGAPWWMPVNEEIQYKSTRDINENDNGDNGDGVVAKSRTVIDPSSDDIQYMDNVKIIVEDNPWLEENAKKEQDKRQYILSIDFQVQCRKYILFTSLLLFLVLMTFISSAFTGFYEWRGYLFSFVVIGILIYGIYTGFVCTEMNRYDTRRIILLLNIYWTIAWIVIFLLFITACVYLVLFPSKFKRYCDEKNVCEATTGNIIFAECSLFCSLLLYITMMFFYMQRIANLVILISNLRDYQLKYEDNKFMRKCHKHMYRYLKGWKTFRKIITKHTGLRLSDILYCSCWFRKCQRNSSKKWRPFSSEKKKRNGSDDYGDSDEDDQVQQKEYNEGDYVYIGSESVTGIITEVLKSNQFMVFDAFENRERRVAKSRLSEITEKSVKKEVDAAYKKYKEEKKKRKKSSNANNDDWGDIDFYDYDTGHYNYNSYAYEREPGWRCCDSVKLYVK